MSAQTGWFEIVSRPKKAGAVTNLRNGTERSSAMITKNGPRIASVAIPERPTMPQGLPNRKQQLEQNQVENEVTHMVSETVQKVHEQAVESGTQVSQPASSSQANSVSAGLEILDTDFVVSLAENVDSEDRNDITMRIIAYNELLRRDELNMIDSNALVAYAKDLDCLYGKDIQCEAVKELARRTIRSNS